MLLGKSNNWTLLVFWNGIIKVIIPRNEYAMPDRRKEGPGVNPVRRALTKEEDPQWPFEFDQEVLWEVDMCAQCRTASWKSFSARCIRSMASCTFWFVHFDTLNSFGHSGPGPLSRISFSASKSTEAGEGGEEGGKEGEFVGRYVGGEATGIVSSLGLRWSKVDVVAVASVSPAVRFEPTFLIAVFVPTASLGSDMRPGWKGVLHNWPRLRSTSEAQQASPITRAQEILILRVGRWALLVGPDQSSIVNFTLPLRLKKNQPPHNKNWLLRTWDMLVLFVELVCVCNKFVLLKCPSYTFR